MDHYQKKVREAFEIIEEARIQVLTALINVAMANEFKDVDALFKNEEVFSFRVSDFDHADDPNVNILQYLVKQMEISQEELIAWNGKNYLESSGDQ
jgi:hypothetical protein